jgi:tetratricopeptide (TPR) repeat protein
MKIKNLLYTLLSIFMSCNLQAHTPGLRVPDWYRARLFTPQPPEHTEPFELCLEFQSMFPKLESLQVQLLLPDGLELLEGSATVTRKQPENGKTHKINWLVKSRQEIKGAPAQVILSFPYPKKELIAEIENVYHSEPLYMKQQLAEFINSMDNEGKLSFYLNLYILETEGFVNIPGLIFSRTMNIEDFNSSFIFYDYSENPLRTETEILNDIKAKDDFFQKVLTDPEALNFFRNQRSIDWTRTVEDSCYNYYLLSLKALHGQKYAECAQWLEKLSEIMLKEEKINYELFLAARNTQALALLAQKETEKAVSLLTSTVRTAASSSARHYLMYNLAVIYEKLANRPQMFHYLSEALRLNPAFTLAKKLQSSYQQ